MTNEVSVLGTIARYVTLTLDERDRIAPLWVERGFRRRDIITATGEVEDWFSIVRTGVHRIYFEHDGDEVCLGFAYDGSWSGVFDSFTSRRPARLTLQAVTDTTLFSIRHADLMRLYDEVPAMARFGRLILEEVLYGRATREIEQLTLTAEERYRRLLQRSPHLLQLVPQKDIASYLRMTPETFSRLRAK